MLGQAPDIACYAKLLTGGVAPLAVTLSTEAVFDAFKGDSKVSHTASSTCVRVASGGCQPQWGCFELQPNPREGSM